jgi:hypothetical protein
MSKSPDPTRDELFAEPLAQPELFTFSESVAGVFPDMINRSVPGLCDGRGNDGRTSGANMLAPTQQFTTSGARGARHCYPPHAKSTTPPVNSLGSIILRPCSGGPA